MYGILYSVDKWLEKVVESDIIHTGGNQMNTYDMVMSGNSDNNIRFNDFRNLILSYGFHEHIRGDHFIYKRDGIPERINIQPNGNKAKAYQVKQVRILFNKYGL